MTDTPIASILVCFAVKEEAAPFAALSRNLSNVEVLVTGMGKRNAEQAVRKALASNQPGLVVSAGFAGGLNPAFKTGSVLFHLHDGNRLKGLLAAAATEGTFYCGDRVVSTAYEKQQLRSQTGADAVEMESGAIAASCEELGVPLVTVRVILDSAAEDLPLDFNEVMSTDMRIDFGKLAAVLAVSPSKIFKLMKFRKQTRFAAEQLAATLVTALRVP